MLFGIGAGLMQVPLANCVLHSQPRERSGIAAALLHASREVAGLYLDGYHTGLLVTVTLVTAGTAISFFTLRPATRQAAAPAGPDPAALAETGNQYRRQSCWSTSIVWPDGRPVRFRSWQ